MENESHADVLRRLRCAAGHLQAVIRITEHNVSMPIVISRVKKRTQGLENARE